MTSKPLVDPRNASRDPNYATYLQRAEAMGVCPFCQGPWDENRTLHQRGSWRIARNLWPYEGNRHYLLIISEEHKTSHDELTPEDMTSVLALAQWACKEFNITGGGLAIRFGETLYSGATVCHLHFHLIQPEKKDDTSVNVIYFPIG